MTAGLLLVTDRGACEVIELPTRPGRNEKAVYAVGYTPDTPNSMILSRGPEGDYLVVTTGEGVFWFGLSDLTPN